MTCSAHVEVDASAVGLIVDDPDGQVNGVDANGDASEDHEDAGQEEDEDEEHRVPLHRDPVLDEEREDVRELWSSAGPAGLLLVIFVAVEKRILDRNSYLYHLHRGSLL